MPEPSPTPGRNPAPVDAPTAPVSWTLQGRLRRRLLGWIGGLWLLGTMAAMGGIWYETTEVLDSSLEETAQMLLSAPATVYAPKGEAPVGHPPHEEHVAYQVFDGEGTMRLRSHQAPRDAMDPDTSDGLRHSGPWHVFTLNAPDHSRRVLVAETRAHRMEVLWASAAWLLVALVLVLVLAALAIRWVLRSGFATLDPSRHELSRRPPHDLHPLDTHGLPHELQPWLETVNGLMARVRGTIDAERAFAAHTAHELRTPLAAARAQAQRLASASSDQSQRAHANALVRQLDRLTHLATRLLQLARIESGVALQREPFDLTELAAMVVDEFSDALRHGRLALQVHGDGAPVHGDIDALGIALRNLIDNALKHGGEQASVVVLVEPLRLSVIDSGPGVPAESLPHLGSKFERGNSAVEGTGLGLAMVRTITQQSDAELELESPLQGGGGFLASIRFNPSRG